MAVRRRVAWMIVLTVVFQMIAVAGPVSDAPAAADMTPPELLEFSFTPGTVDTSSTDQTITFTARIVDDLVGVSGKGELSRVYFLSPSGMQYVTATFADFDRISGDAIDGVYRFTATIPRYSEQGTWTVVRFGLVDDLENQLTLTATQLAEKGFPTTFTQTGAGDSATPQLASFSVTPGTIDTSGGDRTITVTARITDNLSGAGMGTPSSMSFVGPSGVQTVGALFTQFNRVSGTSLDGTYAYDMTVPQFSEAGTWTVDSIEVVDGVGNTASYGVAYLTSMGFPTTFTQTGIGDTEAPLLQDFSFTPAVVDTAAAGQTITFTARIIDNQSGVSKLGEPSFVMFVSPTYAHLLVVDFSQAERVSGTALDGVYSYTATMPRYSEEGLWKAEFFALVDAVGNTRTRTTTELENSGYPTTFTVAEPDTFPPTLVDLSFAPDSVNVAGGDRKITFTFRVTDDRGLPTTGPVGGLRLVSPLGTENLEAVFTASDRVSGTVNDGVYEFDVTVPQFSELGTWTVDRATVSDAAGNDHDLTTAGLTGNGFPTTFSVNWFEQWDGVGLVDPGAGKWYLRDSGGAVTSFYFGNPGDFPFVGDWDCDGVDTPGMYRQSDGYVYLRNSNTQGIADIRFFFGNPGDVPLAGDFNGDGCDTVSIYRPYQGRFYIINKLGANEGGLGAAETDYLFGNPGDKPFVGDFDGDGVDTVGLHRESTGLVYFRQTHTQGIADAQFIYGDPGDRIVAGDWNKDGTDSPALFRPSNTMMYFRYTNTQGNADDQYSFGKSTWLPVAGVFGLG